MADFDYVGWANSLDPTGKMKAANAYSNDQFAQFANSMAGKQVAAGDYGAAAATLGGVGDVKDAQALQQGAAMQAALKAEGAGDVQGARAAASQTGNQSSYDAAQGGALQSAMQRQGALSWIAKQAQSIPEAPGDASGDPTTPRAQYLKGVVGSGLLGALGVSDQTVSKLGSIPLTNNTLQAMSTALPYTGTLKGDGGVETAIVGNTPVAHGYIAPVKLDSGPGISQGLYDPMAPPGSGPIAASTAAPQVGSPGQAQFGPGGQPGPQVPFESKPFAVPAGDTASGYDPNTNTFGGGGVSAAPAPGASPSPAQLGMVEPGGAPGGMRHMAAYGSQGAGAGAASFAPQIAAAEQKYGIPPGLLSSMLVNGERSGVNSVSPKGAIGVAQIMPATAAALGVDPHDPNQAIDSAARYLAQNAHQFGGDWTKAVAAYNAGPGAVSRAGGVPNYPETQGFVQRTMGGQSQGAQGVATIQGHRVSPPVYNPQTQTWQQTQPDGSVKDVASNPLGSSAQLKYTSDFIGTPQYKDYMQLNQFHNTAMQALKQAGGPADLQLLDMALKSNNPTLGIRPNQVEQMMEETGLPNRFVGEVRALVTNGQQLSPAGRQAMVNVVDSSRSAAYANLQPLLKKAQRDAQRYGLDPADLIPDVPAPGAPAPASSGYGQARTQLSQGGTAPPSAAPVQLAADRGQARLQYAGLPRGARYQAPDGSIRVKQ